MATTIGNYSVGLTLDASSYIDGANISRREARELTRAIEQARTPAEIYERRLNLLSRAMDSGAISQQTYARLQSSAAEQMRRATTAAKSYADSIARMAIAYLSVRNAVEFARSAIMMDIELERMNAQFEALTGSASEAARTLGELRGLSSMGIDFDAASASARMMMGYGMAAREALPIVRQFAELTMGDSERMKSLALAFSQASSAGKLMGQDLRQMIDAGFNPAVHVANKMNISLDQAKHMLSQTGSGAKLMAEAFQEAAAELGGLERMSHTASGSISRIRSEWQSLKADIGKEMREGMFVDGLLKNTERDLGRFRIGLKAIFDRMHGRDPMADRLREIKEQQEWLRKQTQDRRAIGIEPASWGSQIDESQVKAKELTDQFLGWIKKMDDTQKEAGKSIWGQASLLDQAAEKINESLRDAGGWIARTSSIAARNVTAPLDNSLARSARSGSREAYEIITQAANAAAAKQQKTLDQQLATQRNILNAQQEANRLAAAKSDTQIEVL